MGLISNEVRAKYLGISLQNLERLHSTLCF
jgi:hypothetical protein